MPEPLYTILVSNEPFKFTRSQLESEPDNYFLTYFFGSFAEASQGTNELAVEKEPILFKLIQAHLRGYNIFPISDGCVPSYMTKEVMVENLLMEAEFYGLERLVGRIKEYQTEIGRVKASSEKKYMMKKYQRAWNPQETFHHSWTQTLGEREYFAMFNGMTAARARSLICERLHHLEQPGYSITMSWEGEEQNYDYALLVSE